jgi:hypothetical protein
VTSRRDSLIRELLALYVRYGPDTFEDVVGAMRRGAVSSVVTSAMSEVLRAGRSRGTDVPTVNRRGAERRTRPTATQTTQNYVLELIRSDRENGKPIAEFVDDIARRAVLTSPHALRRYSEAIGVPISSKNPDRNSIARKIGDLLLTLPTHEAQDRIRLGRQMPDENSTLQAWTDIIVKREPKE